jgi:hypothetical protein
MARRDFDVPSAPNRLDVLVQMRNRADHGRPHLFPQLSHAMLKTCVVILNMLVPKETKAS